MGYPPVENMLGIYLSCEDQELVEQQAELLEKRIGMADSQDLQVIGPADAALAKKNDRYRKVIYIKHRDTEQLLYIKEQLEQQMEKEPVWDKVRVQFDLNPFQAY